MIRSRPLKRLLSFTLKPLLAAIFVTLLLHYTSHSPSPTKPKDPHPHLSKHLVIASTTSSNLTWLPPALQSSHWSPQIYVTDSPTAPLTVPINKGNEAMVYLTYIINNYHSLPDIVFFHHDHPQSWHQLFSSTYELTHLNPLSVLKSGYLSPRCLPGCENVMTLSGDVAPLSDLKTASREIQISSVLHAFLKDDKGNSVPIPEKIAAPCCAQFAVSKEAVLARPLEMWMGLREWLVETELGSRAAGRVLEYTWHLWFGMEPVL
jgi:hypothetical protein